MKYLITGHNGFIGKRLTERLQNSNIEFEGLSKSNQDITKEEYFENIQCSEGDVLIHLANKSYVPDSWTNTHAFFDVNVMATIRTLEFCKENKLGLVYISSYLYGNPDYFPIDESHPVRTNNPYSLSKKFSEELIQFYGESHGIDYNILRPFNIYGTGQKDNFIIPILISQLMDDNLQEVTVKDSRPKRDFIHVTDVVEAIVKASAKLNNQIYNVCSGNSVSLRDLYKSLSEYSGKSKELKDMQEYRKNEIMDCYGSYEKIQNELAWSPKVSLEQGLKECLYSS